MSDYKKELQEAYIRILPHIVRTPILSDEWTNEQLGCKVYFKCENFQNTASFKMRGATNAVLSLSADERKNGVTCHSSGNFAQAVAKAAKNAGCPAHIVMPSNAPEIKKTGVKLHGGKITLCEPTIKAREAACNKIAQDTGCPILHPSNQIEVILGQGTSAMEVLEDLPELDVLLVPVGGGGLLAGTALAGIHYGKKDIQTWAGEPENVDDAFRSLQSGQIESNTSVDTIADGLRTTLGHVNFPIIQEHVAGILTVSESEIIEAMKWIYNRLKIVIEPSCAVPFAALIKNKERFTNKSVAIILTGGNVDLGRLGGLFG